MSEYSKQLFLIDMLPQEGKYLVKWITNFIKYVFEIFYFKIYYSSI